MVAKYGLRITKMVKEQHLHLAYHLANKCSIVSWRANKHI
jgi:hypothetical protein